METIFYNSNWKESKFGPIDDWKTSLVSMASLVIGSSSPMALWWGPDHLLIYNDGYSPIAGERHPESFGQPAEKYWGESWPRLKPIFEDVFGGESLSIEDESVMLKHGERIEVCFQTTNLI